MGCVRLSHPPFNQGAERERGGGREGKLEGGGERGLRGKGAERERGGGMEGKMEGGGGIGGKEGES